MASKRIFESLVLSNEEKCVAKKLCLLHGLSRPSDAQLQTLRAFIMGTGILNLLLERGQYDVTAIIVSYLTLSELVRVAAATTSEAFVELFWTPPNSLMKKMFQNHFFLKSFFHDEPSPERLDELTTGQQILLEYR